MTGIHGFDVSKYFLEKESRFSLRWSGFRKLQQHVQLPARSKTMGFPR
jgi:hypothetical protein